MGGLQHQKRDVHLTPVSTALVLQLVQHLGHVVVAVVSYYVVVGALECLIRTHDGLVPLLRSVLLMV